MRCNIFKVTTPVIVAGAADLALRIFARRLFSPDHVFPNQRFNPRFSPHRGAPATDSFQSPKDLLQFTTAQFLRTYFDPIILQGTTIALNRHANPQSTLSVSPAWLGLPAGLPRVRVP